ncbi:class I SAM-dependent methyltransferase [Humibacillus xanthopallidus]|uniref:Methyltransferase family protein n=1 Tax=Humibacillus xanthopallidus TaxID=412689 RepID=A0A543HG70_9MICO|nr:class I SAM-dependent methyltransferase [Humibacillus xanthopallidus]TQM57283.1 methyltransferase family protein [Humibacillus xanthopallidus]
MSTGYALAYRLGITPWERAGEVARAGFEALLEREEAERSRPLGRALDLGCGRGQHTHELAARGWEAVGVDNIPRAVEAARSTGSSGATFVVGDVTQLSEAALGTFDFFLDVGCFHGLDADARREQGAGVTAIARPNATLLMLAFQPTPLPLVPDGVSQADVEAAFPGWQLLSVEPADTSGMPGPLKRTTPHWYRLRKSL